MRRLAWQRTGPPNGPRAPTARGTVLAVPPSQPAPVGIRLAGPCSTAYIESCGASALSIG
jgi:hypothetical protein